MSACRDATRHGLVCTSCGKHKNSERNQNSYLRERRDENKKAKKGTFGKYAHSVASCMLHMRKKCTKRIVEVRRVAKSSTPVMSRDARICARSSAILLFSISSYSTLIFFSSSHQNAPVTGSHNISRATSWYIHAHQCTYAQSAFIRFFYFWDV